MGRERIVWRTSRKGDAEDERSSSKAEKSGAAFGQAREEEQRDGRGEPQQRRRQVGVPAHPGVIHIRRNRSDRQRIADRQKRTEASARGSLPDTNGSTRNIPRSDPTYPAATPKPETRPEFVSSDTSGQERVVEDVRALERDVREREEDEDARHRPRRGDERREGDAREDERHQEAPLARAVREVSEERRRHGHDGHREAERERELLASARHPSRDVEREMERQEVHREARRPELVEAPRENGPAARPHEIR